MQKQITLSTKIIFAISLFGTLSLYLVFVPPPAFQQTPSEVDTETARELYEDLRKLSEESGLEGIDLPEDLPIGRLKKLQAELKRILQKTNLMRHCVQYALVTAQEGYYISYNSGELIFLKKGEIWKYGKTINGEFGRYPNGLPIDNLQFEIQFAGTELECLVLEKIKIYGYFTLPENVHRAKINKTLPLFRPPGNKIDR